MNRRRLDAKHRPGATVVSILALILAMITVLEITSCQSQPGELLVSAASSLTDVMNEITKAFVQKYPGVQVHFNFAASGPLQQQIEQGAPVDVFASASLKEMDALQKEGKIEANSRTLFAGNRLVLIAPLASRLKSWADLRQPWVRRIAVSNPDSVPSGRYAQQTLTHRGLWVPIKPKIVFGENVRQTLAYVANGDADAGVVFATDARIEQKKVRVVDSAIPGQDHKPIQYPAAIIAGAPHVSSARQFAAFLRTPATQAILQRYGFLLPGESTPGGK